MKIVLTGGPSAGKTSIVEILHRSSLTPTVIVAEAATILFRGGFPRQQAPAFVECQQRAIYHVQNELENFARLEGPEKIIICDRGTLDGLAYWPRSEESFFENISSSMEVEIARYDWVIHLDTAGPLDYRGSEIRLEQISEALTINDKVKRAWRFHPRRLIIPRSPDFLKKVTAALASVKLILSGQTLSEIRRQLDFNV
jgi:predicted ATPase